jgi:hypothetical protein
VCNCNNTLACHKFPITKTKNKLTIKRKKKHEKIRTRNTPNAKKKKVRKIK